MDSGKELSQFHQCEHCSAGEDEIVGAHDAVFEDFRERGLSPREAIMTLTSLVCHIAAAQDNPDAAIEEAATSLKRLFEQGKSADPRRSVAKSNPNVH